MFQRHEDIGSLDQAVAVHPGSSVGYSFERSFKWIPVPQFLPGFYMDELSIQGYWLENSESFVISETEENTCSPYDSTQQYVLNTPSTDLCIGSHGHIYVEEAREIHDSQLVYPEMEGQVGTVSFMHSESSPSSVKAAELSHAWLNQPCSSMTNKLMMAVAYLKQFTEDFDVLVQIWVPVHRGGTIVLTTNDQLYAVSRNSRDLHNYRSVSRNYQFPTEVSSKESTGLPGRAFLGKLPEWSPDVRFFESNECPRLNYAKLYSICGCLAMPVFEQGGRACVAVVEIVTTVQKISYPLELANIYKALQAVELEGSQDFHHPSNFMDCNMMYQDTIPEIAEVLESVCKNAKLPLALTWALSSPEGKAGYDQVEDQYAPRISTVRSACFITDTELLGFYMACSEQYLSLDQGIVGKAFMRRQQHFSTDVTCFSKSDYPLSHHARIFGLRAALAIPLQNIYTGSIDFVLELFFPTNFLDDEEQKRMWDLLSTVLEQACQSFQVVMDKEFVGDIYSELMDASNEEYFNSSLKESHSEDSYENPLVGEAHKEGKSVCASSECPKELKEEIDLMNQWYGDDNDVDFFCNQEHFELGKLQHNSELRTGVQGVEDSCIGEFRLVRVRKTGKRRAKPQKTISLQVIRQYFAESLRDAAKSIGVCPTTLKRICRQHGITRWPSRKIKKVNHSLKKLQLVVDSVQGAKGLIQIGSIHAASPPKSSPKFPHNDGIDSKSQSSSSSKNHKSGLSCSKDLKQPFSLSSGDASLVQDPVAVLKQTFSTAELCHLKDDPELIDRSHDCQTEEGKFHGSPIILPESNDQNTQDYRSFRVKVTFGEENIRFGMPLNWSLRNLQQEIGKRFIIDDFSRIHMKYIDNDHDTIHLDCDADLEEFKELFKHCLNNTIRISLHQGSQ